MTSLLLAASCMCTQVQADSAVLGSIEVIEPAPLPGLGITPGEMPAGVQTSSGDDLKVSHAETLGDYLDEDFDGVTLGQTQDDPFQADLRYHGFLASPLLGAPQGLSVYVDGVRVNEAFGDTVDWDLLPDSAIRRITLIPGSNPVFGLNTLGGALAITTRNGSDSPGYEAEASLGSHGGRETEVSAGGDAGHFDGFLTGHYFQERGWRDDSPSRLSQLFGKLGWHDDKGRLDLSYTGADTMLIGNGVVPDSLLARDYSSIYTSPDLTRDHLDFLDLTALRFLRDGLYLSGNIYFRHLVTDTENGDINDNYLDPAAGLTAQACASGTATAVTAAFCSPGVDRRSILVQRSYGLGAQATRAMGPGKDDQLIVGVSWDGSRDDYAQDIRYGGLTPGRQFLPDGAAVQPAKDIRGTTATLGLYVMDSYSPAAWLRLSASARWNQERLTLGGSSLDTALADLGQGFGATRAVFGDHRFQRLDPALGFTATPAASMEVYGDYDEGMRAPTVVELGCADPAAPCGLPDDFAGDPPLKPVVSHTFELGVRSAAQTSIGWGIDLFRIRSSDDIQFISSPGDPAAGYFANVGDTLRRGLDAHVQGSAGSLRWRLSMSLLHASFESAFVEPDADSNSSADAAGRITVRPGDAMPLVPERTGRASLGYQLSDHWDVAGEAVYSSGSNLRGNENGLDRPDSLAAGGAFIAGSGRIGGFMVFDVHTEYHISSKVSVFMRIDNLLDKRYATGGFLGEDAFRADGSFRADGKVSHEDEVSPGAPRTLWLGVDVHW